MVFTAGAWKVLQGRLTPGGVVSTAALIATAFTADSVLASSENHQPLLTSAFTDSPPADHVSQSHQPAWLSCISNNSPTNIRPVPPIIL